MGFEKDYWGFWGGSLVKESESFKYPSLSFFINYKLFTAVHQTESVTVTVVGFGFKINIILFF